jgi:hypothetical protein
MLNKRNKIPSSKREAKRSIIKEVFKTPMAAFNLEEAARQGRSEAIPPTWARFPASRRTIRTNLIIYLAGAVIIFGLAIYLAVTGSLPGGTNGDQGLAPLELVFLLVFGCVFLVVGLRMIPSLLNSDHYFFLLTTDGFVYVAGKKLTGLPFTAVRGAYRQPGLLGGKLVVLQHEGKSLALTLGRYYSTPTVRDMEEALNAALKPASKSKRDKRA